MLDAGNRRRRCDVDCQRVDNTSFVIGSIVPGRQFACFSRAGDILSRTFHVPVLRMRVMAISASAQPFGD